MKIEYGSHYDQAYWTGKKVYTDRAGKLAAYHGPGLAWDGFKTIAQLIAWLCPGESVLDIGCGGGDLAARLMVNRYDAYGIDISKHAVENCVPEMRGRIAIEDITTKPSLAPFRPPFDLVMATDLMEHIYEEDLPGTFSWMVSKARRWLFLCIATAHDPSRPETYDVPDEFVLKKGATVPAGYEAIAVAGHVNVRPWAYWARFFRRPDVKVRWDLMWMFQMRREGIPSLRETWGWHNANVWILEKT